MFKRVVTKKNEELWLKVRDEPLLTRREIADLMFARWELRQAVRQNAHGA